MNNIELKNWIESGILERYVLGQTNEIETAEVEKYKSLFPEVVSELAQIEANIELLAFENAVTPKSNSKKLIFQSLNLDIQQPQKVVEVEKAEIEVKQETPVIALSPSQSNVQRWLVAASLLALVSIGLNLFFFSRINQLNQAVAELQLEEQVQQAKYASLKLQTDSISQQNQWLALLEVKKVTLNPLSDKVNKPIQVFFNQTDGKVMLNAGGIKPIPQTNQYQLWALAGGNPISLGMFSGDEKEMQWLQAVENAEAFAVTIEPYGGSPTPTMENLVLMGKVSI